MASKPIKYSLRMMKLSGRIFGEYKKPPMPHEISREVQVDNRERNAWESFHYQNEMTVKRLSERPSDLDPYRMPTYYPAHPQLKDLIETLREHGLYRDEHQDIKEELSRLRAQRGKPDRVRASKKKSEK